MARIRKRMLALPRKSDARQESLPLAGGSPSVASISAPQTHRPPRLTSPPGGRGTALAHRFLSLGRAGPEKARITPTC